MVDFLKIYSGGKPFFFFFFEELKHTNKTMSFQSSNAFSGLLVTVKSCSSIGGGSLGAGHLEKALAQRPAEISEKL